MTGRKVLVQDAGGGHMAYVEEGPTILLTGDETTTGHFFRGPDDPADTPAFLALLLPGDKWAMTGIPPVTPSQSIIEKVRNQTNDGWKAAGLGVEVDGLLRAFVTVSGDGIALQTFGEDGGVLASLAVQIDGGFDLTAGNGSEVAVSATGVITLDAPFAHIKMLSLPQADPAEALALWVDPAAAFVVKQSQGA